MPFGRAFEPVNEYGNHSTLLHGTPNDNTTATRDGFRRCLLLMGLCHRLVAVSPSLRSPPPLAIHAGRLCVTARGTNGASVPMGLCAHPPHLWKAPSPVVQQALRTLVLLEP